MPLVVPNTTQCTIRGKVSTHNWANVFHVFQGGDPGPNGQAVAVLDAFISEVLPHLTNNVSVIDAAWVDLDSGTGGTGVVGPTDPGPHNGGVASDACPSNTAYLFRYGGVSERGVRNGRSYITGVREDEVGGGGDIGDTWLATVQGAASSFVSTVLANAGGALVTVHNPHGGPVSTSEILGTLVSAQVATQRRRMRA